MDWHLELESRYRNDGTSMQPIELNFGRAQAELRWLDDSHCVLVCRSTSDKDSVSDLHLAGRRAVLAVHRYVGRVAKIRGIDRSQWLGPVVITYCTHGGPKEYDTTDLMRSAAKWSLERVRGLISHGADVNAENMIGETALSYAAREGRTDVFENLVVAGARTDVNFEGHTLLHEAASGGSMPIISVLVRKGLEISAVDWMGLSPIWYAVSQGRAEAAEYFLAEGADWKLKPWRAASAFPKMREGFDLVCQAEATMGANHRFTKMLRDINRAD